MASKTIVTYDADGRSGNDRMLATRRIGVLTLTTHLLAGMLGIDGEIVAIVQEGDERERGVFRAFVYSPRLKENPADAPAPDIDIEAVR